MKQRGYVARKYYAHAFGAQSIYEEALFGSYDAAFRYILEISEEDNDRFLTEILSFIIDDNEPWENEQCWTFDRTGQLIPYYDAQKRYENCHVVEKDGYKEVYDEPDPKSYTAKFRIGDIVKVSAFPWNWQSPIPVDTIGVITDTPIHYDEWTKQEGKKYGWDNSYVIYFIRDGYLDHMHIREKHLTLFTMDIPENLSFLNCLSEHYKGQKKIQDDVLKDIYDGKIFVEKVRFFSENQHTVT